MSGKPPSSWEMTSLAFPSYVTPHLFPHQPPRSDPSGSQDKSFRQVVNQAWGQTHTHTSGTCGCFRSVQGWVGGREGMNCPCRGSLFNGDTGGQLWGKQFH